MGHQWVFCASFLPLHIKVVLTPPTGPIIADEQCVATVKAVLQFLHTHLKIRWWKQEIWQREMLPISAVGLLCLHCYIADWNSKCVSSQIGIRREVMRWGCPPAWTSPLCHDGKTMRQKKKKWTHWWDHCQRAKQKHRGKKDIQVGDWQTHDSVSSRALGKKSLLFS